MCVSFFLSFLQVITCDSSNSFLGKLRELLLLISFYQVKRDSFLFICYYRNGPEWQRLRKISQQPLLSPKSVASFISATQTITDELVHLIRTKRNSSLEMSDFEYDLYKWALEGMFSNSFLFFNRLT